MLCEEFHCRPSDIWAERQRLPAGFLEQIVEYRRYADAYYANQADPKGWQGSEMRRLATAIEFEVTQEATTGE